MSKGQGQKIAIKFTEEILGDVSSNVAAFSVSGKQYKYVNGPLLDMTYQVVGVEMHPTELKTILLTFADLSRFPTVEGDLTISYDASEGDLAGIGGAVESFTRVFTPLDLIPEPNPNQAETITVVPIITLDYQEVAYLKGYAKETNAITVSPASVTLVLTDITIINP